LWFVHPRFDCINIVRFLVVRASGAWPLCLSALPIHLYLSFFVVLTPQLEHVDREGD